MIPSKNPTITCARNPQVCRIKDPDRKGKVEIGFRSRSKNATDGIAF